MKPAYRKLPGTRRGVIRSSSAWMAADHILLVKSLGFREEYKRFHLRDVQAIAIAKAPRFHLSTRAMLVGAALVFALAGLPEYRPYLWTLLVLLAAAWVFISAFSSCRCRIYTAVSSDELPSVYRSWTARKFLAAVESKVAEVQGVLEGDWADAAESRDIGPAPVAEPPVTGQTTAPAEGRAPSRTTVSYLFVSVLFASGLFSLLTLDTGQSMRWAMFAFMFAKVGLAVAIFVQHYKGRIAGGMQTLAIATLLAMGALYYVEQLAAGFAAAAAAPINKKNTMPQFVPVMVSGNRLAAELNGGASLVLGCVALGIMIQTKESEAR